MSAEAGDEASLLSPRILLPFLLVSLIWGSTWFVIRDQISEVPPTWSVGYRFIIAAAAMFALVAIKRLPFRLDAKGQFWAILIGIAQFSFNFNFVYFAEGYITSGLVAVFFALLMVPNAILGRIFLGQNISGGFITGSIIASLGVALLFVHEYRSSSISFGEIALGIALAAGGLLSASIANVMQALPKLKPYPIITLLAWAMFWGAIINIILSWITFGPPVFETRGAYVGGIFYLAIVGSVITFPLYFRLVRELGAGKAAYTGVLIPIVAMILSTIFEEFVWTALPLAGAALALAGLMVALRARKSKADQSSNPAPNPATAAKPDL